MINVTHVFLLRWAIPYLWHTIVCVRVCARAFVW